MSKIKNKYTFGLMIVTIIFLCITIPLSIVRSIHAPLFMSENQNQSHNVFRVKIRDEGNKKYEKISEHLDGIRFSYDIPYINRTVHQSLTFRKKIMNFSQIITRRKISHLFL